MLRRRFPSTRRWATFAIAPRRAGITGSKSRCLPSAGQRGNGWAPPRPGRVAELGLRAQKRPIEWRQMTPE
eukprot:1808534-Lingulodinium_polyedra.AAC.1